MPFKFQWIQLNGPGATDPSSLIFVCGISCIQSSIPGCNVLELYFITLPSFCYGRFKIHSGNRLIVVWSHVLDLHMELCGRSIDFYTDFHVGCSSLWALNENTKKPKVCLLFLRLSDLLKVRVKSHIAAAWQCSKHSPFAQLVNKVFPFF